MCLQGEAAFADFDCALFAFRLGVVDRLLAVDPELDPGALAADAIIVPVVALDRLVALGFRRTGQDLAAADSQCKNLAEAYKLIQTL